MSSASGGSRLASAVHALLEPKVREAGFDLEDVALTPAGKRRLLRLVVDKDGGVSLDDVASVSTAVSAVLDGSDVLGAQPYVLEVTSPGVDRPLTAPRHWRRAAGRLVSVVAGDRELTGRVVDADDDAVVVEIDGAPQRLPYDGLGAGRIQVEFRGAGSEEADA